MLGPIVNYTRKSYTIEHCPTLPDSTFIRSMLTLNYDSRDSWANNSACYHYDSPTNRKLDMAAATTAA